MAAPTSSAIGSLVARSARASVRSPSTRRTQPLDLDDGRLELVAPRDVVASEVLETEAERRQRRAELVRRIGDELVLGAEERIELDDHVVELAGELLQLGRAVERRPRREVPSGDLPGGGLDPSAAAG